MEDKNRAMEIVRKVFDAVVNRDLDRCLPLFADDAIVNEISIPPVQGKENIRPFLENVLATFPRIEIAELKLFPGNRSVAAHYVEVVTSEDGSLAKIEGVDVFELDDAYMIRQTTSHWDHQILSAEDRKKMFGA